MIDEVTITNLYTAVERVFDKDNSEFLLDDDGITIEELKSNYNTYSVYGKLGKQMDEPQLSSGIKITLTGWIIHTYMTTLDDKKQQLVKFFNPLHKLNLRFKDRQIQGYVQSFPKFGASRKENNDLFCKFQVTIFCPDPSFKVLTKSGFAIQMAAPSPYVPPEGYVLKRLNDDDVLLVDYAGTLSTPIRATFNPNPFISGGTWTEAGVKIQQLYVEPGTNSYSLSKIVGEFATQSITLGEKRLYTSEPPAPGWYGFNQNDEVISKYSEMDQTKPEFLYLNPGINALRLVDTTDASLSCYTVLIDFQEAYAYPKEVWG